MNLFVLDEDIQKCAEYHVDSHVVKMPSEATQMLTNAVWVDKLLGYVPRKLTKEELAIINEIKKQQPSIEERTFTRFLPTHLNHPASVWTRSSMDNYEWVFDYCEALNTEFRFRWRHEINHKSFDTAVALPDPQNLPHKGITVRPLCMPEDLQHEGSDIDCYRMFYMLDKAPFAVWKRRFKPPWWDERFCEYMGRDPHQSYLNTVKAPTNKKKLHSRDYEHVS